MKKIFLMVLFVAPFVTVNAQLKDMMIKKAGDKLKSKKESSSGNNTSGENSGSGETAPGNTNTNSNTENNQQNQQNPGMNPFMSGGSKEIRPKYVFHSNVLMEMKSYDKKGQLEEKSVSRMRWQFSNEPYVGFDIIDPKSGQTTSSISEIEKNQFVMLMENDGQKVAMVRKIDPAKANAENAKEGSKPTVTKTGRTKQILGYNCEEWTSVDEKGNKSEMWMTSEIQLDMSKTYAMSGQANKNMSKFNSSEYPQGFMMEMIHYDVDGEKFTMTAIEVNLKAEKTIDTAGYVVY